MRAMDFGQTDRSAAAFARAAEIAPSPKILRAWAVAELTRGDLTTARRIYRRLTERAPDHPTAWGELATVSLRMGDSTAARGEARRALEVRPDDRQALRVLQLLEPATGPDAGTSKRTGSR
jgi:Flp pilus assembly protein TadD